MSQLDALMHQVQWTSLSQQKPLSFKFHSDDSSFTFVIYDSRIGRCWLRHCGREQIENDTKQYLANVNVRSMRHTIGLLEKHLHRSSVQSATQSSSTSHGDEYGDNGLLLTTTIEIPLRGNSVPLRREWKLLCPTLEQLQKYHNGNTAFREVLIRLEPCSFLQSIFVDPLLGIINHLHAQIGSMRVRFRKATGYEWDTTLSQNVLDSEHTRQLFDVASIGLLEQHDSLARLYQRFMQIRYPGTQSLSSSNRVNGDDDGNDDSLDDTTVNQSDSASSSIGGSASSHSESSSIGSSISEDIETQPSSIVTESRHGDHAVDSTISASRKRMRGEDDESQVAHTRKRAKKERERRLRKALL